MISLNPLQSSAKELAKKELKGIRQAQEAVRAALSQINEHKFPQKGKQQKMCESCLRYWSIIQNV